jgi:hypothetical protein
MTEENIDVILEELYNKYDAAFKRLHELEKKEAFNKWWYGEYGMCGIRAEYPETVEEGAYMAWSVQQEKINKLQIALINLIDWAESLAGDCHDEKQAADEIESIEAARKLIKEG